MVGRVAKINTYSRKLTLADSLTKVYPLGMIKLLTAALFTSLASCTPGLVASYERDGVEISTDGENVKVKYESPSFGNPQK